MNNIETPKDLEIDDTAVEFNSQIEYFKMLYRIQERRNIAYETGIIEGFFRSTMNLLSCSAPKFKAEGYTIESEILERELTGLWNKISSLMSMPDEKLKQKNARVYEFDLMKISSKINQLILESGITYPKKKKKTIEQAREEDY
jgi:hypothetical protein